MKFFYVLLVAFLMAQNSFAEIVRCQGEKGFVAYLNTRALGARVTQDGRTAEYGLLECETKSEVDEGFPGVSCFSKGLNSGGFYLTVQVPTDNTAPTGKLFSEAFSGLTLLTDLVCSKK